MKHTAGQWHFEPNDFNGEHDDSAPGSIMSDEWYIATIEGGIEEAEANARLIAAAPDLLEACRYMHTLLRDMGHGGLAGAILGENAIAKAQGERP